MSSLRISQIRNAPIIDFLSHITISKDTISFGQGIPFFSPPQNVMHAVKESINDPISYEYSTDSGRLVLRQIIAQKIANEQQITVDSQRQIMVTNGANQAFINTILSITDPGDEIIFFSPTYFNYVMAAQMLGCKPILIETDENFQPDISLLTEKISNKTKAIVTISPNNPTGAVYQTDIIKLINELCNDHSCFHISDEVYEYFLFDNTNHHSPLTFDGSVSHTISLFSLSKSFALSGYRIGYMVFPKHLYNNLLKSQDTVSICAPSISQIAAINAIPLSNYCFQKNEQLLLKNRDIVKSMFSKIDGINLVMTKGAYYFFITVDSSLSSFQLAKRLAEKYNVIVLPGSLFDHDTCSFRLSYGNLQGNEFVEGMNRLTNGLMKIIN